MKPRKSFLLRLDPALYTALEHWAEQELRSVNGQIEFVLKQAVTARDRKALPPEAQSGPGDRAAIDG
ncbi:MAG: hypothetical protein HY290_04825 [Planctomycetia bacterium]|nr:hypothetical protein [Planctomycetia bacterium]